MNWIWSQLWPVMKMRRLNRSILIVVAIVLRWWWNESDDDCWLLTVGQGISNSVSASAPSCGQSKTGGHYLNKNDCQGCYYPIMHGQLPNVLKQWRWLWQFLANSMVVNLQMEVTHSKRITLRPRCHYVCTVNYTNSSEVLISRSWSYERKISKAV